MVHCGYAFMLAISSFYMAIASPSAEQKFTRVLDDKQKTIYDDIRQQRLNIYFKSILLSLCISSFYYFQINKDICYFIGILLTCTNMFYMLMPKSKFMINYVNNDFQNKKLFELHQEQKRNGILSSFFAILIWVAIKMS